MNTRLNIDQTNIILMLVSAGVALIFPFELVLVSYAFLGPAHYLTQISWMHDRQYFIDWTGFWFPCVLLSLLLVIVQSPRITYFLYAIALSFSLALVSTNTLWKRISIASATLAILMLSQTSLPLLNVILLIFLPTILHIYVFTGCFILNGAIKSKNGWAILSFIVFVCCSLIFTVVTPVDLVVSQSFVSENIGMFKTISLSLREALSLNNDTQLINFLAFLSFAYTYHYLNWFSKADVIKWHRIPKKRLGVIVVLYILSVGIYIYDYKLGFYTLLSLSLLHVVLEFPLNMQTMASIGRSGLSLIKFSLKINY